MAVASAAVSAAGAVAKEQAEQQAADQQTEGNKRQAEAIQRQRDGERMDAERQQQDAYAAAASSTNEHAQQAYKDLAAFDAISSESGNGVTAQRGAAAIGIRNGQDQATLAANARRQQTEIGFGDFASQNKASASLAAIKPVTGPSMLEAGLTIASAGVTYGTTMNKIKNAKGGS
jgi:hypothetical protein